MLYPAALLQVRAGLRVRLRQHDCIPYLQVWGRQSVCGKGSG